MRQRQRRGIIPNLPRGLALLRATGPASVRRGRIGPAGPRGAHWQPPRGPPLLHDSLRMEIIGWQCGWYLPEHTHTHTWKEVRWSRSARGGSSHARKDWRLSLTRLSHTPQNTHCPTPCDEPIQTNFVQLTKSQLLAERSFAQRLQNSKYSSRR